MLCYGLCALHNLIRKLEDDNFFLDQFDSDSEGNGNSTDVDVTRTTASPDSDEARNIRDQIAEAMWARFLTYKAGNQNS